MLRDLLLSDLPVVGFGTILYHKYLCNADGSPMRFKVNGACQAFKRNLNNARLPWKHGLWSYGYITSSNVGEFQIQE